MKLEQFTELFVFSMEMEIEKQDVKSISKEKGELLPCQSDRPWGSGKMRSIFGPLAIEKATEETFDDVTKYLIRNMVRSAKQNGAVYIQTPVETYYIYSETNPEKKEPEGVGITMTVWK